MECSSNPLITYPIGSLPFEGVLVKLATNPDVPFRDQSPKRTASTLPVVRLRVELAILPDDCLSIWRLPSVRLTILFEEETVSLPLFWLVTSELLLELDCDWSDDDCRIVVLPSSLEYCSLTIDDCCVLSDVAMALLLIP